MEICLHTASGRHTTDGGKRLRGDRPQLKDFSARNAFRTAGIILTCLLLPVLFSFPVEAREDSARLVFQKTALNKTRVYVVKKGDFLAGILRKQRGKEKKREVHLTCIPHIKPEKCSYKMQ